MSKLQIYVAVAKVENGYGWCTLLVYDKHRKEISGFSDSFNPYAVEMSAIVQGLKQLKQDNQDIDLYCSPFIGLNFSNYDKNLSTRFKKMTESLDVYLKKHNITFCYEKSNFNSNVCLRHAAEVKVNSPDFAKNQA